MQEHIAQAAPDGSGRASSLSRRGVLASAGGALAVVTVGGLLRPASAHAAAEDASGVAILTFHTMIGVSGPFVGAGMPIRGIPGGGLPWRLREAEGELRRDGRLRVRVRGLVLAAGPKAGTNPVPTFRAIVSFEGAPPIFTPPVPASSEGDADINAQVDLPDPGFAPIIFVAAGAFVAWFAVTGNP
jgi:hypothetical protein